MGRHGSPISTRRRGAIAARRRGAPVVRGWRRVLLPDQRGRGRQPPGVRVGARARAERGGSRASGPASGRPNGRAEPVGSRVSRQPPGEADRRHAVHDTTETQVDQTRTSHPNPACSGPAVARPMPGTAGRPAMGARSHRQGAARSLRKTAVHSRTSAAAQDVEDRPTRVHRACPHRRTVSGRVRESRVQPAGSSRHAFSIHLAAPRIALIGVA